MKAKHIITLVFAVLGIAASTSCSTMKGLGKDIQKGGEKLENSAESAS